MKTFKQELTDKIDNEHQYCMILRKHGMNFDFGTAPIGGVRAKRSWWAHREDMRLHHEVYEVSAPLDNLNGILPVYSHISKADPLRVAHTPDKSFGERDAQLVINLGKLLTRYYPGIKDEVISEFVSQHESEISNEVEFIEYDKIAEAYVGIGTGACMSHASSTYGGFNPASIYGVPGIRLAVLRNKDGDVTARTLVYEPSETDLRFIRCYGDAVLRKRLEKRGYRAGALHGAVFKTTPLTGRNSRTDILYPPNTYVMPYIDGNGGMGSPSVSYVAMIDNVLTSVKSDYANQLQRVMPGCAVVATNTCGYTTINNVDSSSFSMIDVISGLSISSFGYYSKYLVGGVERGSVEYMPDNYVEARTVIGGDTQYRNMLKSEAVMVGYTYYDLAQLANFKIRLLDAEFYPEAKYASYRDFVVTKSGKAIAKEDSVIVIANDTDTFVAHKSEIQRTGKGKHIKVGANYWAVPGIKLYVTPGGRKVHPLGHAVVKLYDSDMYEFQRNARLVTVLGDTVWLPKVAPPSTSAGSAVYQKRIADVLELRRAYCSARKLGMSGLARGMYESLSGGLSYSSNSYYNRLSLNKDLPVAAELARIKEIAKTVRSVESHIAVYAAEVMLAEMNAIEAPHYMTDAVLVAGSDTAVPVASTSVESDLSTAFDVTMAELEAVASLTGAGVVSAPLAQEAFGISNALTWHPVSTTSGTYTVSTNNVFITAT